MSAPLAQARIEVTRSGPTKPWLGQLVPVNVDVWRPKGDAPLEPFSLDDVAAAGMIVKWSEHASPPDETQEGEVRFLVQHRTLLVFPQSHGELSLPPVIARWTDPVTKTPVLAHSSELRFEAASPPAAGTELPLVAGSVSLEQTFDRDLSKLRVGDGFTRTLTLHATETDPVIFPEISPGETPGMTGYPMGPRVSSNTERGEFQADLTLRTTYVVERVGPHRMPGVSLRWLEPRTGRYRDATVPELTLWTGPNPSLGFQCLGTASSTVLATEFGSLAMLGLLAFAIVRRLRRGPGRVERALKERSRERRAFHQAVQSLQQGPALLGLQKLYAWLAVRFPATLDRTLTPLKDATQPARDACEALEKSIFRTRNTGTPERSFVAMLRRTRKAMGRARRPVALERLNPARINEGGR
ncbi:MAG: hypothetical protein WDO69_00805 [Pseudomonadota bacterium]